MLPQRLARRIATGTRSRGAPALARALSRTIVAGVRDAADDRTCRTISDDREAVLALHGRRAVSVGGLARCATCPAVTG